MASRIMPMSDSPFNKPRPTISLSTALKERIEVAAAPYPKPPGRKFEYGTAGFRMKANSGLDHVIFSVGLTAACRSKKKDAIIGIMITASHNPAEDNGVKLVDPMGDMLEASWEDRATILANAPNNMLATEYENLINDTLIDELRNITERKSTVIYARDTRESGPHLVKALKAALDVLGVESTDYGFLTTPQLHYVTRCLNTAGTDHEYGVPTEEGYYMKMAEAFKIVMIGRKITGTVTVDCANGVGGPALQKLIKYLPPGSDDRGVDIKVVNDDTIRPEALNFECGADYVKTKQRAPPKSNPNPNERCCSLDGDADRIVYYYTDEQKVFHLLDGDRIATLGAVFIVDLVRSAGLEQKLSIGLVQTAYANGASTEYARDVLKLQVICTPTGVKHLHHAAARNFDIGVYFEANGHGTVLFSAKAIRIIHEKEPMSPGQLHALQSLKALIDLINQTVGDALSDMLLTEVVLAHKCWTPNDWENTYIDMPNRLVRVEVADRSIFKTTDAERKLVEPRGIQDEIDKLCQMVMSGRAFARASGTEDAVRVYAEAHNRVDADSLAAKVADVVRKYGTRVSK